MTLSAIDHYHALYSFSDRNRPAASESRALHRTEKFARNLVGTQKISDSQTQLRSCSVNDEIAGWAHRFEFLEGVLPMTITALQSALAVAEQPAVVRLSAGSAREVWAERRRVLERSGHSSNPEGYHGGWQGHALQGAAFAFAWAARVTGIHARGRRNALSPGVVEREFAFPDLPAVFEGYRILQISDPHFDCLPELARIARRLVRGLDIDLVAITGDIHGSPRAPLARSTLPLADLLAGIKVRDRVVAVLGNHDPARMADALEHVGITALINESAVIERGSDRLVVTGLDDVHRFYTPAAKRALREAPAGFRIVLVHSAEIADHAAAAGFALYLCGHTHGGQICLPNGRWLFTGLRRCRFGARGEWRAGAMIGYTSNGLGVGEVPLRFNCPGEIAVITLRRGTTGISRSKMLRS
jgi:hypothetical protein